jgi:hypothetical protein
LCLKEGISERFGARFGARINVFRRSSDDRKRQGEERVAFDERLGLSFDFCSPADGPEPEATAGAEKGRTSLGDSGIL